MTEPLTALLSDVHGNALAFDAVLADIRRRGISTLINLGDVIGYGPEPEACINLAMAHCTANLSGNHEYAVLHDADGFNPVARQAVDFVRQRLKPGEHADEATCRHWNYLQELPADYRSQRFMAMHGSPRHCVMEYVLPSDPEVDPLKLDDIFEIMDVPVAFIGHTHFPGVIVEGEDRFLSAQELEEGFHVPEDRKVIVNVGSVGQPRDRDVRSCYVSFDGCRIRFHRVDYDVQETVRRIHASDDLHESLGHRLLEGR